MSTRTSQELVWGSFWTAFWAERGADEYHNGSFEENVESPTKKRRSLATSSAKKPSYFFCVDLRSRLKCRSRHAQHAKSLH
eukprot:11160655-Alexandrium_andersonii.AAC.1